MALFQIATLAIVASFVALRARLEANPKALFRRLFLLALASWLAQDSCIRAYGFLDYSPSLWLFLDRVPLIAVLAWPIAIQSARDLATCLWPGRDRPSAVRVSLTVFGLALADAALVQPIGAQAHLWHWTQPGIFSVPPIGILGCAYFAAACAYVFERAAWYHSARREALVLLAAPVATHLLLLATWWAALRWVNGTLPSWPFAILAWIASLALAAHAAASRARQRVPPILVWLRLPFGLLFAAVLVATASDSFFLLLYAFAFAPPYLAILSLGPARPAPSRLKRSLT